MPRTQFNAKTWAIFCMGFASGLPILLVGSTLQAWYTVAGVNIIAIGTLSLVGQPYIYKFLWAPLLDRYVPFPWGRRLSWIFLMQLALVWGLIAMAWMNPSVAPLGLALLALVVALASATQDVAIDAYRADVLNPDERGMGAAFTTIAYRVALLVSGAGALIVAGSLGWRVMYLMMAGLMALQLRITYRAPRPLETRQMPRSVKAALWDSWKELMRRESIWPLLLLIVTYKLTDAFGLALNTTFLLRDLHFTLAEVGSISKVLGLAGALLGSVLGGYYLSSLGLYRSLWWFGLLQALSNVFFLWMAVVPPSIFLMGFSVFADYFCGGLASVAFVAFLMGLCHRRYTATQYALFSALSAVGRVLVGPIAGLMVSTWGWVDFYIVTILIGFPALGLLRWMKPRFASYEVIVT